MASRKAKRTEKRGARNKEKAFVDAYFNCGFNATEAAKRAGYRGNRVTLASVGYENLRKPQIAKAISERMAKAAMEADEILARLAAMARGDVSPFLTESGDVNFTTDQAKANIYLLKKARVRHGVTKSGEPWEEREVELHDPQAALVHLARHLGLFGDRNTSMVIDVSKLTDEQLDRIADGEDPIKVLSDTGAGRTRAAPAAEEPSR